MATADHIDGNIVSSFHHSLHHSRFVQFRRSSEQENQPNDISDILCFAHKSNNRVACQGSLDAKRLALSEEIASSLYGYPARLDGGSLDVAGTTLASDIIGIQKNARLNE